MMSVAVNLTSQYILFAVGEAESLKSILAQHQLPVLVKMACDRSYRVKVGQDWKTAGDLGNLLIMKYFEEKFMMIHCLFEKSKCCVGEVKDCVILAHRIRISEILSWDLTHAILPRTSSNVM